eukprot:4762017-Lingulodinium_polyedra.AAC.1
MAATTRRAPAHGKGEAEGAGAKEPRASEEDAEDECSPGSVRLGLRTVRRQLWTSSSAAPLARA